MKLFSERYKELLSNNGKDDNSSFCSSDEISFDNRRRIVDLMYIYNEPHQVRRSRYDDETDEFETLELAINKMNDILGYERILFGFIPWGDVKQQMAAQPTYVIFDIIELQYEYLSYNEKNEFKKELNELFESLEVNWILLDGRMIKIDSEQFEFEIKVKTLQELHKLKEDESKFQSSYDELYNANHSLKKGDYPEAINWAGKSYESLLKVLLDTNQGNASNLIQKYIEELIRLPENANVNGFKDNVLMALPYIRNNFSAHGAGSSNVEIDKPLANLAVNLASALDTYLVEEYKNSSVINDAEDNKND